MEPREGARSAQPRAAQKAEQKIMKRRPAALLVIVAAALWAYPDAGALDSKTRVHVEALASDRLDGRLTGSAGERLAGDYLVSQLQKIGARPLPGRSDYRLPFEFTGGTPRGGGSARGGTRTIQTSRGGAGRPPDRTSPSTSTGRPLIRHTR